MTRSMLLIAFAMLLLPLAGCDNRATIQPTGVKPADDKEMNQEQALAPGIIDFGIFRSGRIEPASPYKRKEICGEGKRNRVTPINDGHDKATCLLLVEFAGADGLRYGTGFLVTDTLVLTAGHNVYSQELNKWADRITIVPGNTGGADAPFGKYAGVRALTVQGWTRDKDELYDYAAVRLAGKTRVTVNFKLGSWTDSELRAGVFTMRGYPDDCDPKYSLWNSGPAMKLCEVTPLQITHMLDSSRGNSGGPVIPEGKPDTAVAVHIRGGCPSGATRLTDSRIKKILEEWGK